MLCHVRSFFRTAIFSLLRFIGGYLFPLKSTGRNECCFLFDKTPSRAEIGKTITYAVIVLPFYSSFTLFQLNSYI